MLFDDTLSNTWLAMNKTIIDRPVLQGAKILLVEDNVINQEVVAAMLNQHGMVVDVAENGKQALEMVDQKTFDCVLMDIQMPVMDGITATKCIRNNPAHKHLPILAMTAKILRHDVQDLLQAGMNYHIPKPVDLETMLDQMAYWITAAKEEKRKDETPVANAEMDECLEKVGGDQSLFFRILNVFIEKHTSDGDQIQAFMDKGKTQEAEKIVHALKGVAPVVGATELHETALALEKIIQEGDMGKFPSVHQTLATQLSDTIKRLQHYLSQNESPPV